MLQKYEFSVLMSFEEFLPIFSNAEAIKKFSDILIKQKIVSNRKWYKESNIFRLIRNKPQFECSCCGATAKYFGVAAPKKGGAAQNPVLVAQKSSGKFVNLTFDHIIPKSLGGSYSTCNGDILCNDCNVQKSNTFSIGQMINVMTNDKYLKMIGFDDHPVMIKVASQNSIKNGPIKISASRVSLELSV